jgi:hypothetical protein
MHVCQLMVNSDGIWFYIREHSLLSGPYTRGELHPVVRAENIFVEC